MNRHLSPEQIDGWVIGERTPDLEAHLQSCGACTDEVARVTQLLTVFGGVVRSWGEEQMGPLRASRPVTTAPLHWWRMGLAIAALLLLIAAPVFRHRQVAREAAVIAARTAARTAAQDELLLRQVQQEISQSVPAPMESLAKLMPNDLSR